MGGKKFYFRLVTRFLEVAERKSKMKAIHMILALFVITTSAWRIHRPEKADGRACGTSHPDPGREQDEVENRFERQRNETSKNKRVTSGTIDLYFHVIRNGVGIANGDVPDSAITNQIRVLNRAFDTTGWTFRLVRTTRTTNAEWYSGCNSATRTNEINMKNALRVGTARTLNVYTCNPSGDLLGWGKYF